MCWLESGPFLVMPRTLALQQGLLLGDSNNAPSDVVLTVAFFGVEGRKVVAFVGLLCTPVGERHAGGSELGHELACHGEELLRSFSATASSGWRNVEDGLFRSDTLADLVKEVFREDRGSSGVVSAHEISDEFLARDGNRVAVLVLLRAGWNLDGEFTTQRGGECFVEVGVELRVALLGREVFAPLAGVASHAVVVFGGVEWHLDGDFEAEGGVDIDPVV